MWNILDLLYECNIGYPGNSVLPITSNILQIEHQLLEWQSSLAPPSSLVTPQELRGDGDVSLERRFRVILTLRYHNVRILAHRRMLDLYLGSIERTHGYDAEDSMLKQVGHRSKGICMQSASDLISIVHILLHSPELKRGLLGAWWFTLYYSQFILLLLSHNLSWRDCFRTSLVRSQVVRDNRADMRTRSFQRDADNRGPDAVPASWRFGTTQLLVRDSGYFAPSPERDTVGCTGLSSDDRQGKQDGGQVCQIRGHA